MLAVYDLHVTPPTYDVVSFLGAVEQERLRRGEDHVDIWVAPDDNHPMIGSVVAPACELLPSTRSVKVSPFYPDFAEKLFGYRQSFMALPIIVRLLQAGVRPLRAPNSSPKPKLITFTLREAEHHPPRNSRVPEWVEAAKRLERRGWEVLVIRDTRMAFEPLQDVHTHFSAAHSLLTRARLYASAVVNVGVNNGPIWLSFFMDRPTLMIRPTTPILGGHYDDKYFVRSGVPRGSQLPGAPEYQQLVWEEDTADVIEASVLGFLEKRLARTS